MKKIFSSIKNWTLKHKVYSTGIIIIILIAGYYTYRALFVPAAVPQYSLSPVRIGSIVQTVSGTGQVTSLNQTDVKSQVSGTIKSINVSVGQHVQKGDLLATIDATTAALDLANAKIAFAKLTQPAKAADTVNATNNLDRAYSDGFNAVSTTFLDLPTVMSGMKDLLYGQSGFLGDQKSSHLTTTAQSYRQQAGASYDLASNQYATVIDEYKNLTRTSATSSIEQLITDSYSLAKNTAIALQNTQNTITFITTSQSDYYPKDAVTASANVNSWSSQINSDLTSLLSSQNNISSNKNTLNTLMTGADPLDIQSQQVSLQQKQQAYDNYFIRAPFDGVIGRIPVNVYDQASGSSIIATIVGDQKISNISLNEVDAAKVQNGQLVNITFDAIDSFTATGTVSSVDQVGTVSSGVVSYGVRIIINTTDSRIKPGMSVNTSIVTKQIDNVLIVPSTAIKTSGKTHYVETVPIPAGTFGSSTSGMSQYNRASNSTASTSPDASYSATTTGSFIRGNGSKMGRGVTVSTATTPTQITVTIGDTDDTNTEIIDGLTRGQFVITKTVAAGSAQTTAAPSILSSLGAQRGATGGIRTGGGAGGLRPGN